MAAPGPPTACDLRLAAARGSAPRPLPGLKSRHLPAGAKAPAYSRRG